MRIGKSQKSLFHLILISLLIAVLFFSSDAFAAIGINKQLPYQAVLKTSAGVNVADGDFDILFNIYSVSTGGSPLWTGTHTATNGNAVTVTDGVFSELLGSGTGNTMTIDFTDDTLYLGITIGADPEMTPRKRIGASGYAFNADTVDGIDSLSFLRSDAVDTMSASSTSAILTITQTGTGDIFNVFDGATEVFTILDGGNVGIGDTSPVALLTVGSGDLFQVDSSGNVDTQGTLQAGSSNITLTLSTGFLDADALTLFAGGDAASTTATSATGLEVVSDGLTLLQGCASGEILKWQESTDTWDCGTDAGASASPWTTTSNVVHLNTSTDNITIGSSSNLGKLVVDGDTDEIQLLVQGNSTQSTNLVVFEQSDGTDVFSVSNAGLVGIVDTSPDFGLEISASSTTGYFGVTNATDGDLFVIDETGNVGIGTTTPSGILHISTASSTNALVVESPSGNVGIGTTDPLANLAIGTTKDSADDSTLGNWPLLIQNFANDTGEDLGIGFRTSNVQGSSNVPGGGITFERTAANSVGSLHFKTSPSLNVLTTRMTIDSVGNVGIGETLPNKMLHIEGSDPEIYLHGTSGNAFESGRIRLAESTTGGGDNFKGGFIHFDGSANVFNIGVHDPGDQITGNDVNAISIDRTTADVGIGTTTPSSTLHVLGDLTVTATTTLNGVSYSWPGADGTSGQVLSTDGVGALSWATGGGGITGTEGQTITFDSSGAQVATSTLFISSAGNVGIGTTTPSGILHVSTASSTNALVVESPSGNVGIGTTSPAGTFHVSNASSSNAFVVAASGNVGVGSTNPDNGLLVIATSGGIDTTLIAFDEGSGGGAANNFKFRGDFTGTGTSNLLILEDFNGNIDMAWSAGGNVGIGNSALVSAFEVVSSNNVLADLAVEENYHFKIRNPNNTTGEGIGISFGMSSTNSQQTAAIVASRTGGNGQGDLRFYTKRTTTSGVAPAFAMIIDQSGNVGIGETSPADLLDVDGDIRVGSNNNGCVKDGNGTVIAGTCSSDAALKNNVVPLSGVLEKLIQIEPVTFNWRAEEFPEYHFGTATSTGLIAQNVEEYFPQYVSIDKYGYKTVNFSALPMLLLQGLREQQEQIFTLSGVEGQTLQVGNSLQGNINGNLYVEYLQVADATFAGTITVKGHATFGKDTAGEAKILAGDTSVEIIFTKEYQYIPIVAVTARGVAALNSDFNYVVDDKLTSGFRINISQGLEEDVEFDWYAFGVDGGKIHVSDGTVEDIQIMVEVGNEKVSDPQETESNNQETANSEQGTGNSEPESQQEETPLTEPTATSTELFSDPMFEEPTETEPATSTEPATEDSTTIPSTESVLEPPPEPEQPAEEPVSEPILESAPSEEPIEPEPQPEPPAPEPSLEDAIEPAPPQPETSAQGGSSPEADVPLEHASGVDEL